MGKWLTFPYTLDESWYNGNAKSAGTETIAKRAPVTQIPISSETFAKRACGAPDQVTTLLGSNIVDYRSWLYTLIIYPQCASH